MTRVVERQRRKGVREWRLCGGGGLKVGGCGVMGVTTVTVKGLKV